MLVSDSAQGVRTLTISNPARRNALDADLLTQLNRSLDAPRSIRAFLVRGAGESFSAGYDLNELAKWQPSELLPDDRVADVLDVLMNHRLPSVALVTGPAFGAGCELAMACDVRVGSVAARFCMPPARLGLVYSQPGFKRFISRIGPQATRFLFLTGRQVEAERALQLGLLDLLEPTDAETTATMLAEELAATSSIALEGTKAALALAVDAGPSDDERDHVAALRRASYEDPATRAKVIARLGK